MKAETPFVIRDNKAGPHPFGTGGVSLRRTRVCPAGHPYRSKPVFVRHSNNGTITAVVAKDLERKFFKVDESFKFDEVLLYYNSMVLNRPFEIIVGYFYLLSLG